MKLLAVDWAFMFPSDGFGHSEEDHALYEAIWTVHAADILVRGDPLPRCAADAAHFWGRFIFAPRTQMLYGDSGMYAVHERVRRNIDEVWLYSPWHCAGYHHDAIKRVVETHEVNCENWVLGYAANDIAIHMRYPAWRHYALATEPAPLVPLDRQVDNGATPPLVFDRVYTFKSPAWVPSWNDDQFAEFVRAAPFRRKVSIPLEFKMVRDFDLADAERGAEDWRRLREAAVR